MSKDRVFPTGSRRDNAGKPPLSKLPWTALGEVAFVQEYGDGYYGIGNWRKGQTMSTFLDCSDRHVAAFTRGEDMDPKSGKPHLAHAAVNLLYALHQQIHAKHYANLDDRIDDFGNWVNETFAQTDAAKLLAAGASSRQDSGNGEADPVNVKAPQNGGEDGTSIPSIAEQVTDELLREGH